MEVQHRSPYRLTCLLLLDCLHLCGEASNGGFGDTCEKVVSELIPGSDL